MADPEAGHLYETIGLDYAKTRRPDRRIAAAIEAALGPARSVINIGAGTGSYEPAGRTVLAIEPSLAMIRQRPPGSAPVVQAAAERLPADDASFDAALAVLTVHHWADRPGAFAEIRRVVRERAVFLTFLPDGRFWLHDYFPGIATVDLARLPDLEEFDTLGTVSIAAVPIPHDCTDQFLAAHWRRPAAYLDPVVRTNISAFALLPPAEIADGVTRLENELASGAWAHTYGHLLAEDTLDTGYRLVTVEL